MRFLFAVMVLSCVLHARALAQAAPQAPRYGQAHQVVLSGAMVLNVSTSSFSDSPASETGVRVSPSFDWFVAEDLSLGAFLTIGHESTDGFVSGSFGLQQHSKRTELGGGLRAGYNFTLGERWSFHPKLALTLGHESRETRAEIPPSLGSMVASSASNETNFGVLLDAPLLFHVAPHFFVGFGPELFTELVHAYSQNLSTQPKRTTFGFFTTVGGWF